jgi:hypothetical protein
VAVTALTVSATAERKRGSVAVNARLWMMTVSPAGVVIPACRIIWSARPDWPMPLSWSVVCRLPAMPPSTVARTTNSSQPKTAVLRCLALQPPMVPAMPGRGGGFLLARDVTASPWTQVGAGGFSAASALW